MTMNRRIYVWSLLGSLGLAAAACAGPVVPAHPAPTRPAPAHPAPTSRDTAAVIGIALSAVAEEGLDLERRLWLRETPAVPVLSAEVLSELSGRVPGLRPVENGREMRQCPEGEPRTLPGSACPILDDGVVVWFYRLEVSGDVASVGVGLTHPGHAAGRGVLLRRDPDGDWVFDRFNGGFIT